jgi:hypothetical protein
MNEDYEVVELNQTELFVSIVKNLQTRKRSKLVFEDEKILPR